MFALGQHAYARKVVVLQPGYLPWVGYFDQMMRADIFVHYDDVQFDKHGWRNRNRIKSPSGSPYWLTVPVRHGGLGRLQILDVEIDNRTAWARKHIGTIRQFYARAPFVSRYLPELEEVLHARWDRLVDLNLAVTDLIRRWLGIKCETVRSSQLGISGGRTERLVAICRHFGADCYLSGNAAITYLDVGQFAPQGITVEWQDFVHPIYKQQHGEFVPYLSVIDLILNCGEESADVIRQRGAGKQE